MKKFNKFFGALLAIVFVSVLSLPGAVSAATTPSLGAAANYGVLGSTYTNTSAGTTVNGSVGFTTGPAVVPGGIHTNYGSGAPYATAGGDQNTALSNLSAQACTFNFAGGAINLSTDTTHGVAGVYTPGVYCSTGAMSVGGPLNLNGNGTYIFRPAGALTSAPGAIVSLSGGALACDVFWTPTQATTLAANTTFLGTVIDNSGITIGANSTLAGMALAFGGTVTTDTSTVTVSTCPAPVVPVVVPAVPAAVPPLISIGKIPTLLSLSTGSGLIAYDYTVLNIGTVPMSNITVNDNLCSPMVFLSGDTNNDARLDVNESWKYRCTATVSQTTTNTVVATGQANGFTSTDTANATVIVGAAIPPPLINVVKTPNVFLLPSVGGLVTYTYVVTNPGSVPLNNISLVDNRCNVSASHSGDLNNNNLLENNEAWVYTCQASLSQTTTNTATAEGSANGLTAIDYALATVVVPPPSLPVTGFPPQEKNNLYNIVALAGALIAASAFYIAKKKQII